MIRPDDARAFDDLPLDTLEEASGELHRRIALAMRDVGEDRADEPDRERLTPRRRLAALATLLERRRSSRRRLTHVRPPGASTVTPQQSPV